MKLVRRSREERSVRDQDAIETNEKRAGGGGESEKEIESSGRMRGENRGKVGGAMGSRVSAYYSRAR